MPTDPTRVKAIFLEAAELPDDAARAEYLDRACGADAGLRERVEALFRSHDPDGSFLGTPVAVIPDPDQAVTRAFSPDADATATRPGGGSSTDDEVPLGFLEPATRPDSLGRIGHYEVLQVIGQGGFGIVFRAFDDVLHRVVAVKVLAPQLAATSPARKRFLREARSSAQVRHENVVQVYEVGEQPLPYIAMEFIPGETLQDRLKRVGPVDAAEVVRVGRQVAEGLAAAHATDLIHRDIKPGNILLEGGAGRVKITDFGLARAADDASISQSGIIAGTPMYMAPEQALGAKLDQRADLFSLGSVLYQMACGRPPFRANGTVAVLKRVAEDTPRDIREIVPEVPQWLCDIISKLHAKNPDERYQSAREVADVLADCEAQLKANSKLRDFSRIPRPKVAPARRSPRRWVAAAIILPVIVLALTEMTGVTQLLPRPQATPNPITPGGDQTPVLVAKQEPLPPTFKNTLGMEFVKVPKGKAWLGGGKDKLGDREVEIPADFYLGKYEVTQEEWEKVMGENPSEFGRGNEAVKNISEADLKRFPVDSVSWEQCQVFVAKLNKRKKEAGWVYRLPTEVEWEYAYRGGPISDRQYSAFDFYLDTPTNTLMPESANFGGDKGLNRTCKVGSYPANRLGLFDMVGNVCEWCADPVNASDDAPHRVARGLGWNVGSDYYLRTPRGDNLPSFRHFAYGLRLARVPSGASSPEAKTPPVTVAPFTNADVKRIAALPAEQQVEEVRKELMRRNPGFDGKLETKIEGGIVTEFKIVTDHVTDIAPIRVFNALRVLELGGAFHQSEQAKGRLADLSPLTGMDLSNLTYLSIANNAKIDDADLVHFKNCKNLRGLWLNQTQVTNAGMANFEGCKKLQSLNLKLTKVDDAGLAHFKDCKDLNDLDLGGLNVTDDGLANFKDCKGLNALWLNGTRVTDAGLAQIKGCTTVTHLHLARTQATDAGLANLKDCKDLSFVVLENTKVTDAGLVHFKNCQKLSVINLVKTSVTAGAVDEFKKTHPKCRIEWDGGVIEPKATAAPFTDADVKRIAALPAEQQVEEVRKELVKRNPGFDGIVEHKIEGDAVVLLGINTDKVTDISPIRVFNTLRVLNLGGTATEGRPNGRLADLTPLREMKLSGLTMLSLANTPIDDAGLAHFKDCKSLEILWLNCTPVTNAGVGLFKSCTALKSLTLNNTRVDDAGLVHFKDCKGLTGVDLGGLAITDTGLAHFKDCKDLTHLVLYETRVTNAGLAHFKDCKDLTFLHLKQTSIGDAGLAHFKDCKKLTWVDLAETEVTDACLTYLAGVGELTHLNLAKAKVTAKGVEDLAKALPKCKIEWDGGVIEPK